MAISGVSDKGMQVGSEVANVNAKIQSTIESLNGLVQDLASLIEALKAEIAGRPDPKAFAKPEDFAKAMNAWQERVARASQNLQSKTREVETKQGELRNLQGPQMSSAQQTDARRAQEKAETTLKMSGGARMEASEAMSEAAAAVKEEVAKAIKGGGPRRDFPTRG